jgi:hypothetical protein
MTGKVGAATTEASSSETISETISSHDEVTIQLAKKESQEHLHGMAELRSFIKTKPLQIKAYSLNDPSAPTLHSSNNEKVKIVHFVRHGQGFHNLLADIYTSQGKEWTQYEQNDENNPYVRAELVDAPLTDKGRKQAKALQPQVEAFGGGTNGNDSGNDSGDANSSEAGALELVALSTCCRALQTGVIAFQSYTNDIPFIAHEMVRETIGVHVCDQRSPISSQKLEFPMVDFNLVESDEDVLFTHDKRESKVEIGTRVYTFLEWLELRDEKHIGVASHSGWLLALFNGVLECDDKLKSWFSTGEMRSVKLVFSRSVSSSSSSTTCEEQL